MKDREREPAAHLHNRGDGTNRAIEVVDVHQRHVTHHAVEVHAVPPLDVGGVTDHVPHSNRISRLRRLGMVDQFSRKVDGGHG